MNAPVHTDLHALLDHPEQVAQVPPAELPALALRVAALQTAIAARLHSVVSEYQGDDCDCFDVDEVSHRLKCSIDLVRERGEEWGIAKVLARDTRGRPTRVVYPKALLRAYLQVKPEGNGRGKPA